MEEDDNEAMQALKAINLLANIIADWAGAKEDARLAQIISLCQEYRKSAGILWGMVR